MQFPTITSPHSDRPNSVTHVMLWVILALIPGTAAMVWYFSWGILINMVLACITAVGCEALVLKLRGRAVLPTISDLSAIVTALLFAIAIPPLLPWWLTVLGTAFAIVMVKQLYGGLGHNPFNPAMAAYALLLISYPVQMTTWLPPAALNTNPLNFTDTLRIIFGGSLPAGLTWDALTMATPLDAMRTSLEMGQPINAIYQNPLWGTFSGHGWEGVAGCFLLGGVVLLIKRIISWHIPTAMLGTLFIMAMAFHLLNPELYPAGLFHLFSGGAMLGAFFIATDPVTACTSKRGQLIYGACIGLLVYVIRSWGGYPEAVAFAVLLMNMAAPTIDHYTKPRVFGANEAGNE